MRLFRLQNLTLALSLLATVCFMASVTAPVASAQTNITGALVGVVSDSTGAIVPGAAVTVTNLATGATRIITTGSMGEYRVSLLPPGNYSVVVAAAGFEKSRQTVSVGPSAAASANITLSVGKTSVTVEVTGSEVPLLHLDDAQLSTTFTEKQILTLPNPGNDLTFIAQTAPGTTMNTQSGYGNFSSFGLPGTANTFTVNGGYFNDPFFNIANSGASNLMLGANDIASETVTANAYNVSFGGLGGAQVSQVTRSGGNRVHGNLAYWWNGRTMNANSYINKQGGNERNFDNVNQWAAAIGGPIRHDKTFFFVNYEALHVVLPSRSTVYAPDDSYQSQVMANLDANGLGSEKTIYQNIFDLYNNAPGRSTAQQFTADEDAGGYGTVKFSSAAGNYTHEWLINGRVDHTLTSKDHLFGHMTADHGVQATYTNAYSPLFNSSSAQPSWAGQLGEQHTFSSAMSNQFLFAVNHYVAVFGNPTQAASNALVPFALQFTGGDLAGNDPGGVANSATMGGENYAFPQGRNVTGYQFSDDLSWTKGKHTLAFGWTIRRNDITDFSPSLYNVSQRANTSEADFRQGYVTKWRQRFPTRMTQPLALYAMGWYAQDQWKALPNLTITFGLRMEHNSNPVCRTNCFAHLANEFDNTSALATAPYNGAYGGMIASNLGKAFPDLQKIGWQPRVGFVWQPFGTDSKTTVRGGFGMFADAFPGIAAEDLLLNAPDVVPFTVQATKAPLVPTTAGSAYSIAEASNTAFVNAYKTANGTLTNIQAAMPSGVKFSAPNITTPKHHISNPTYEEWSLAVEQQLGKYDTVSVMYVGNHSYHTPVENTSRNAYNVGATGFATLPTSAPNPNFSAVTEISSSGIGNFNGVVLSEQHRSKNLTLTFNYQWSHALDEVSNGGFAAYTNNGINPTNPDPTKLHMDYGNADYDIRHYVSASFVYSLPHYGGPKVLVDNWEVSGTVFHSTGLPFSVTDYTTASSFKNYGAGVLYAQQIAPLKGHNHCGGTAAVNGTQCAFTADYKIDTFDEDGNQTEQSATDFGQSRRNQMYGPNYTDVDLSITKGFTIPHWETGKLKVGAQFFNLFNHPNFGQPDGEVGDGKAFGTITTTVNPPTSILGSFLGGDASPRLIQLMAKFEF